MRPRKPPSQHELREARPFRLEEHVQVARADALPSGNQDGGEVGARKIFGDVGLGGAEPRRAETSAGGELRPLAGRADHQRNHIVDMRHGEALKLRARERSIGPQELHISGQKPQRLAAARDRAPEHVIEARRDRCDALPRHSEDNGP